MDQTRSGQPRLEQLLKSRCRRRKLLSRNDVSVVRARSTAVAVPPGKRNGWEHQDLRRRHLLVTGKRKRPPHADRAPWQGRQESIRRWDGDFISCSARFCRGQIRARYLRRSGSSRLADRAYFDCRNRVKSWLYGANSCWPSARIPPGAAPAPPCALPAAVQVSHPTRPSARATSHEYLRQASPPSTILPFASAPKSPESPHNGPRSVPHSAVIPAARLFSEFARRRFLGGKLGVQVARPAHFHQTLFLAKGRLRRDECRCLGSTRNSDGRASRTALLLHDFVSQVRPAPPPVIHSSRCPSRAPVLNHVSIE